MKILSSFRIMWLQVIFDLPVKTRSQRKNATGFRKMLLDLGFDMEQFSVYLRFCPDKNFAEKLTKDIERQLPPDGSVKMLMFTDRQYENIRVYKGKSKNPQRENPAQLSIF